MPGTNLDNGETNGNSRRNDNTFRIWMQDVEGSYNSCTFGGLNTVQLALELLIRSSLDSTYREGKCNNSSSLPLRTCSQMSEHAIGWSIRTPYHILNRYLTS